jgi:hypothetical protein
LAYSNHHVPRCQHIKTNGIQCNSPALRRKRFCFFHNRWRQNSLSLNRARRLTNFELPVLEDGNSIQAALMEVMRLVATQQMDHKTAGLLLYALQIASSNLVRVRVEPLMHRAVIIDPRVVASRGVDDYNAWSFEDFPKDDPAERVQPKADRAPAKRPPALTPSEAKELKQMDAAVRQYMPDNAPLLRSIAELSGARDG